MQVHFSNGKNVFLLSTCLKCMPKYTLVMSNYFLRLTLMTFCQQASIFANILDHDQYILVCRRYKQEFNKETLHQYRVSLEFIDIFVCSDRICSFCGLGQNNDFSVFNLLCVYITIMVILVIKKMDRLLAKDQHI